MKVVYLRRIGQSVQNVCVNDSADISEILRTMNVQLNRGESIVKVGSTQKLNMAHCPRNEEHLMVTSDWKGNLEDVMVIYIGGQVERLCVESGSSVKDVLDLVAGEGHRAIINSESGSFKVEGQTELLGIKQSAANTAIQSTGETVRIILGKNWKGNEHVDGDATTGCESCSDCSCDSASDAASEAIAIPTETVPAEAETSADVLGEAADYEAPAETTEGDTVIVEGESVVGV